MAEAEVRQHRLPRWAKAAAATFPRWEASIFLLAVALYLLTLGHGFVFDDGIAIVRNVHVRSLAFLPHIFTSTEWSGSGWPTDTYRPLTVATYAVNYLLTGLTPWSYHLFNVLLYGVVSLLVYRLGRHWRLPVTAAVTGALVFVVHPVHVEAVASVVGRKELLAAAFVLTVALSHRWALNRGGAALVLPVVAFGGAMLSKEVGVVAAGLVLLHDLLLPPSDSRPAAVRVRRMVLYAGYGLALAAFLLVRWWVVGGFVTQPIAYVDNPTAHVATGARLLTATAVIGKGLGLLALPLKLSPDYSFAAIPIVVNPSHGAFVATILGIAGCAVAAVVLGRREPTIPVALCWYLLTLLPASSLLFTIGTIFGERLLFLPSVAFCLMAGLIIARGTERAPRVTVPLLAVILVALAAQTVRYSLAWADELTLFSAAVQSVPNSSKAHFKLGEAMLTAGRPDEAAVEVRRALAIHPGSEKALILQADIYRAMGQTDEAERAFQHVLALQPNDADALYGLGRLLREAGRIDEASRYWRRALVANPRHAGSLSDLGTLSLLTGDSAMAQSFWERAVQANPTLASAWYNLGLLYRSAGKPEKAREAFEHFVEFAGREYAAQAQQVRTELEGR